ncbi:Follistatin-related protein 1 [Galemys pyrenaicus]|uniref:Follistatin-related protein 1 n=1 Tax=Galemys pyrenaicus TaxID=202257 RepID=A0A8J6AJA7_GALPY|nr:Follistatin-related protein 1 [Galemys pyrenaicus]
MLLTNAGEPPQESRAATTLPTGNPRLNPNSLAHASHVFQILRSLPGALAAGTLRTPYCGIPLHSGPLSLTVGEVEEQGGVRLPRSGVPLPPTEAPSSTTHLATAAARQSCRKPAAPPGASCPSGHRDPTKMWTRWLALALVAVAWVHAEVGERPRRSVLELRAPRGCLTPGGLPRLQLLHQISSMYLESELEELRSKSKICANVFCGAGRECAVTEKGEPTCLCIEQCKPHKRPVCGSNGKTYLNHCELHRDACLTGSKIQVDYDGHCKEKKSVSPSASPVVCYQSNRDELRRRIIQWLEAEIIPDGWFSKGSNYSEILDKYFKNFDDGDSRLDSREFLKFVEQNETAINITTYADQENNKLLRGLCVNALIELSDENADWRLSFQEFLKCLNPSFNPPEKKCALEDETYADGAETEVDCNRCVCACGNWVCTAMTCDGKNQKGTQTQTEEEMTRYVKELQKHQVSCELHALL